MSTVTTGCNVRFPAVSGGIGFGGGYQRRSPPARGGQPDAFVGQGTTATLMASHGLTPEAVAVRALAAAG